jgi:voltage-gated potassium channel
VGFARSVARSLVEHPFTLLFSVLLFTIAGHGILESLVPGFNPLNWLLGIVLVAVVFSAGPGRLRWALGALALACVAGWLLQGSIEHAAPALVSQALVALVCLLSAGLALRRALASGPVDAEHICAALDTYMLVGIGFGVAYWTMESALPGSFSSTLTPPHAIYFSFVTQATLGFGDIVPQGEHAQGVVIVQGVGGQMYLAVLVARLVSLYSAGEKP